jgi:Pyridoxamine 5'-phosphate oxidase
VSTWREFAADAPALAARVNKLFAAHKHHTMATLRLDGSPRISGTEVRFDDGELLLGMMLGTRRAADLRRDPRMALHTHTVDPVEQDQESWPGDAKLSGTAVAVPSSDREPQDADWFRVDLREVAYTGLGSPADHLIVESWTPVRGLLRQRR